MHTNGDFHTKGKGSLEVKFFEYSKSKVVFLTPEVVEYDGKTLGKPAFDLIIGTKTMNELGIILNFKEKMITIDEIKLPMRSIEDLPSSDKQALSFINCLANDEPKSTEIATQRVVKILDAKYEKANLPDIVQNNCSHLNSEEQSKLLEVLNGFENLFDGTLGDWDTKPVSFELKEGAKPYHGRAFPIPKVHKETILTEIKRLIELDVLEWQPASEWAAPSFIQPKKKWNCTFFNRFQGFKQKAS